MREEIVREQFSKLKEMISEYGDYNITRVDGKDIPPKEYIKIMRVFYTLDKELQLDEPIQGIEKGE